MNQRVLNLVAAVLCGIGSIATLLEALASDEPKRAQVLSGVFGTIGSIAWAASAYQDLAESSSPDLAA